MQIEQQVYHSFTLGSIMLSHHARQLMQKLRNAIVGAISDGAYASRNNDVSRTRGELAQYISSLEQEVNRLRKACRSLQDEMALKSLEQKDSPAIEIPIEIAGETHIHLPPIPEGYILERLGDLLHIVPIGQSFSEQQQ